MSFLYVNAYLESQRYGGPEEGGWYYQVGEPLASIPIPTSLEKGKGFYVTHEKVDGKKTIVIKIETCNHCNGTGLIEESDPDNLYGANYGDNPYTYDCPCPSCGKVPANPELTATIMAGLQDLFKDECDRYERIVVCLSKEFAESYPKERPTYE